VWCHKLVKSLEVQQTFSFHFSLLQPDHIPECFYVNNLIKFLNASMLPSYGWPKFALKWQIMPFLKSFEFCQKLGF